MLSWIATIQWPVMPLLASLRSVAKQHLLLQMRFCWQTFCWPDCGHSCYLCQVVIQYRRKLRNAFIEFVTLSRISAGPAVVSLQDISIYRVEPGTSAMLAGTTVWQTPPDSVSLTSQGGAGLLIFFFPKVEVQPMLAKDLVCTMPCIPPAHPSHSHPGPT